MLDTEGDLGPGPAWPPEPLHLLADARQRARGIAIFLTGFPGAVVGIEALIWVQGFTAPPSLWLLAGAGLVTLAGVPFWLAESQLRRAVDGEALRLALGLRLLGLALVFALTVALSLVYAALLYSFFDRSLAPPVGGVIWVVLLVRSLLQWRQLHTREPEIRDAILDISPPPE